jgi:hypothetical protein
MIIGCGKVKDKMKIEQYCYGLKINKDKVPSITPSRKPGIDGSKLYIII